MLEKHMCIVRFAKLPSYYEFGATISVVSFVKALCNALTRTSILSTFETPYPRVSKMTSALLLGLSQHGDKISKSNRMLGFFTMRDKLFV